MNKSDKIDDKRLISVFAQFRARLKDAPRKLTFRQGSDFTKWKKEFRRKVLELLGRFPKRVPLNIEILEEEIIDDFVGEGVPIYKQQKIVYNTEPYASCVAYLLIPEDIKKNEKRPAILSAHGHGSGKNKLIGWDPVTFNPGNDLPNYEAAAIHFVREGYIVIVPDWRPFGERKLNDAYTRPNRDPCNVTYMSFGYFGYNLLALNVWDAMRTIDVLETISSVDKKRIGMVGKSYGGTMTTYTAALDNRIKAAVISGYLSTLNDALSMRALGNYCGSQYLPGLLEWGDIPDIAGLIAPRPLLIEAGKKDECFVIDDATKAYKHLHRIYHAANASEKLSRDVADVEHSYIFKNLLPFLAQNL
ncbi:MAG: acetylxylan esterase [Candidatus Lokiarchaeota archaeon]|nr:acetylxylan esterase [Candidatus Lokiarchaeota archaeon]